MREDAMFADLIVSRRCAPCPVRKIAAFGCAALLYVLSAALLVLTPLLVAEAVDPPRAGFDPIPVFRVWPPSGTAGAAPSHPGTQHAGSSAGRRDTPARPPGPLPRPPAPRPVVVPLAPPASEPAPTLLHESGPGGPAGGRPRGSGEGPGPGDGRGGPGCEGCAGNTNGDGTGHGGDSVFDEQDPRIIPPVVIVSTRTLPKYPELARRARVEGSVILLITIDREGRVGEVEVLRSPDPRYGFDLAAIEAVRQWRYRPALLDGRPVAVQASVMVEFAIGR